MSESLQPPDCRLPASSAHGISQARQEYWSGLPFPSPGDLPNPRIKHKPPALVGGFFTTEPPGNPPLVGKGIISSWKDQSRVIKVCECQAGDGAHADLGRSQCICGGVYVCAHVIPVHLWCVCVCVCLYHLLRELILRGKCLLSLIGFN